MKPLYILLLSALAFGSCKKTEQAITQVVTPVYPTITLNGEALLSSPVGGTYTDPGAVGYDSLTNTTTQLTPISNNVDLSKAGFYFVRFMTANKLGYRTYANRLVLATSVPASDDISGVYHRTTNNAVLHIVKVGTGVYRLDNVAGVLNNPDFVFPFFIGFTDAATFQGPTQSTPVGAFNLKNPAITRNGTDITLSWVINGAGFPDNTRTFKRD